MLQSPLGVGDCDARKKNRALVRLLFDSGSQRNVSEKLQIKVLGEKELEIFTFGDNTAEENTKWRRVEFLVRNQHNRQEVRVEALEVPCICADLICGLHQKKLKKEDINMADVPQATQTKEGIGLLIRVDYYWASVTGSTKRLGTKLIAMETAFVWILQSQTETSQSTVTFSSAENVRTVTMAEVVDKEITANLGSTSEPEHLGIKEASRQNPILNIRKKLKFKGIRFKLFLPKKPKAEELTDNRETAEKHQLSHTTRLQKREQLTNNMMSASGTT